RTREPTYVSIWFGNLTLTLGSPHAKGRSQLRASQGIRQVPRPNFPVQCVLVRGKFQQKVCCASNFVNTLRSDRKTTIIIASAIVHRPHAVQRYPQEHMKLYETRINMRRFDEVAPLMSAAR